MAGGNETRKGSPDLKRRNELGKSLFETGGRPGTALVWGERGERLTEPV